MLKVIFKNRIIDFRPAFFVAIYVTLGILCSRYMEKSVTAVYLFGGAALLLAAVDGIKNKNAPVLLLYVLSFTAGLILFNLQTSTQPLTSSETQVTGRVTDVTHYDTRSYYILDSWDFADKDQLVSPSKKIRFATEDRTLIPGDIITFSAQIVLPDEKRNIGGFDERMYLLGKGIDYKAKGTVDSVTVLTHKESLGTVFWRTREYLKQTIENIFPKRSAGIAKGLILGDKSDILEADYEVFKRGGTASILAVSGLHFGILSLFIFWILSLVGVARKPANVVTAVFMLLYAGIVGFSVSATRALVMGLAVVFANLLGKQKDYLSFLSLAFVISLIISPATLFSAGFMLSFGAVFALLVLSPIFSKPFNRIPSRITGLFTAPVAATIGTAPFIINFFYYFSVVGIAANIVVIPIGSAAVVLTFIAALLGSFAGVPVAWLSDKLIWLMQTITEKLTALPFATVDMAALPTAFIVLWFVAIFAVSGYCLFKPWIKRVIACLLVLGMAAMVVLPPMLKEEAMRIYFADVGQGDAILITTPEGENYLVDTGEGYMADELIRVLKSQGIHLDGLFLTHADSDHIGGAKTLLDEGLVDHLYLAYAGRNTFDFDSEVWTTYLELGEVLALSQTVYTAVLSPKGDADDDNDNEISLCLLITYQDYHVLLTGDINLTVEKEIMDDIGDLDVLKVTHHGTKYGSSPEFLAAVKAETAVISCGENYYGHPAPQTLYNLGEGCDIIYRTDRHGGILVTFGEAIDTATVLDP